LLTLFVWAVANVRPRIFESGFLPYLGRISFSVYILHFLVLGAVDYVLKAIALPMLPAATFFVVYLATLAIVAVAATLTFRFIEQPCIRLGRRLAARPALSVA
jgi:peptidoglycan/LPS O-acetylase OafA/YrhL